MKKFYRKPYRIKRKKSIFKNRFFWLSIVSLAALGGIFYLVCFSYPFQIKEVKISGNEKVPTEELRNLIQEKIVRNLFFSQTKSIFLVDFSQLKSAALEKFPQISQINFKRKFPQIIEITVKERISLAVFCQNENCFSLDSAGIIFEPNVTQPGCVTLGCVILRKEGGSSEVRLGEKVLKETLVSKILEIGTRLEKDFKILTKEILVVSEERTNFKTSEGWEIYLNPQGDLDWQLTKLKADLDEEIPEDRLKDLEYIDVRFENFAPYKFRD